MKPNETREAAEKMAEQAIFKCADELGIWADWCPIETDKSGEDKLSNDGLRMRAVITSALLSFADGRIEEAIDVCNRERQRQIISDNNYVEADFGNFKVTLQRKDKPTPHQKRKEAEAELTAARREVEKLQKQLNQCGEAHKNALQRQGENAGRCAELMDELTALRAVRDAASAVARSFGRGVAAYEDWAELRDALVKVSDGKTN